jgi:hypothetical protein
VINRRDTGPSPTTAGRRACPNTRRKQCSYWTIVLASAEEVDLVRARVPAAGLPVDEHAEGFAVRDPAGIAVLITTSN